MRVVECNKDDWEFDEELNRHLPEDVLDMCRRLLSAGIPMPKTGQQYVVTNEWWSLTGQPHIIAYCLDEFDWVEDFNVRVFFRSDGFTTVKNEFTPNHYDKDTDTLSEAVDMTVSIDPDLMFAFG